MATKKNTFESNLDRLKEIVETLDSEQVSLEDSLKLFEEGIKLYRKCNDTLSKAEQRISVLVDDEGTEKEFQVTED